MARARQAEQTERVCAYGHGSGAAGAEPEKSVAADGSERRAGSSSAGMFSIW